MAQPTIGADGKVIVDGAVDTSFNPNDTFQSVGTPGGTLIPDADPEFQEFMNGLGDWAPRDGGVNPPVPPVSQSLVDPEAFDEDGNPIDDEEDDDDTQAPPVVNSPEPTVRIGDRDVPLAEVSQLYELGKALQDGGVTTYPSAPVTGEQPTPVGTLVEPVAPIAAKIPDYIDQDDEVQMGLWKELQARDERLDRIEQTTRESVAAQARSVAVSQFNQALGNFTTKYPNLTEAELNVVRVNGSQILPAIQATEPDPVKAMEQAMYIAGLQYEPSRNKVLGVNESQRQHKSSQRKRKQSSIGGSSGSVPRTPTARPRPRTDREAVNEFAEALGETFQSNGRIN